MLVVWQSLYSAVAASVFHVHNNDYKHHHHYHHDVDCCAHTDCYPE